MHRKVGIFTEYWSGRKYFGTIVPINDGCFKYLKKAGYSLHYIDDRQLSSFNMIDISNLSIIPVYKEWVQPVAFHSG